MMLMEKVNVPEGESGIWKVVKFEVPENSIGAMRLAFAGRPIKPGAYTRLMRGGTLVMSDTPAEMADHYKFIWKANGRCLINGLGLGMCLAAVLKKETVTHVTVIEKSQDVISLVGDTYSSDPRVEIIHADAFDYAPPKGVKYGAVWHDIWDNICADNLPEMHRLHRKYGRRAEWQGSWCRYRCERGRL